MSQETLQRIIGVAIIDKEFRQHLLSHRDEIIADFDLTTEERGAILAIKAESF